MFFEVETNHIRYQIDVWETKLHWHVKIRSEENGKETHYKIQKKDYQYLDNSISFIFKNSSHLVDVIKRSTTDYVVYCRGSFRQIEIFNDEMLLHRSFKSKENSLAKDKLFSEMPGKVVKVLVKSNQKVKKGETLLIIEAMKMENEIRSSEDSIIKEVHVVQEENIDRGTLLLSFKSGP